MRTNLLVPAIVFFVLSIIVIIGNLVYMLKGQWGIWNYQHWSAIIFHAVTMLVGLYLLSGAVKKEKED